MGNIVAIFSWIQAWVGTFAGFGVDDSHSVASFLMVISLSMFGAACVSHFSGRRDNVHVALNVLTMFAGGIIGNAILRGLQLPLANELVLTVTLALFGMSASAIILLLTYNRTQF
jgi:hypothetical protein